jgi:tRNA-modifying protein YgfZ
MDSTTGSPLIAEDYRSFRDGKACVPLDRWTVIHLTGPDTAAFLQGLASQDLAPGSSRRTYFLTEKGRPLALAWVWIADDGASAWVVADDGARDLLPPHFERFRIMEEVEFVDSRSDHAVLGVSGGSAGTRFPADADPAGLVRIDTEPLSLLLAPPEFASRSHRAEPAVFEPWRIAAGLPRTGVDFDLDRIVTELDDPDAVSLTKGCYVGQEVVARTSNRGQVRRRRIGFRFDPAAGLLSPKSEIRAAGAPVGFVTSSALEPGTSEGVGMGYVSTEALAGTLDLVVVQGSATILLDPAPWPLEPR